MVTSVKVRAPSSTANLGPGFDVFGLALNAFYDEITLSKTSKSISTNNMWQPSGSHHMPHQGVFIKDFHLQVIFYKFINFHVVSI